MIPRSQLVTITTLIVVTSSRHITKHAHKYASHANCNFWVILLGGEGTSMIDYRVVSLNLPSNERIVLYSDVIISHFWMLTFSMQTGPQGMKETAWVSNSQIKWTSKPMGTASKLFNISKGSHFKLSLRVMKNIYEALAIYQHITSCTQKHLKSITPSKKLIPKFKLWLNK